MAIMKCKKWFQILIKYSVQYFNSSNVAKTMYVYETWSKREHHKQVQSSHQQ